MQKIENVVFFLIFLEGDKKDKKTKGGLLIRNSAFI